MSWFLRVVVLLCLPAVIQGQSAAGTDAATADFGTEPYVIQSAALVITRGADGTGTDVQTIRVVIHSDAALRQLSVVTLSYAALSQQAEFVYARVTHSDGSTQETPISGAIEQAAPVTQQAPLYSDLKVKQLPVKSLRAGDTLEWQTRIATTHPEVANQFWGQHTFLPNGVVLNEVVELRVPSSVHLTAWTNPRAKVKPEESTEGLQHVYRWRHSELQPTVGVAAEAFKKAEEKRVRSPEEEQDLLKGELPSLAFTTFPDWAAVGAWYQSLETDRMVPDAAIKAKVAELTAGSRGQLAQAQAIYRYVSTQIRYVGIDFGIGRYQPHTAVEVFANQYGDCKDKHTLLASMLQVINVQVDPVLIGAGIRFNSPVPSPAAFNHVISRLELEDHTEVWLDATVEIGEWGALLYPLRDHEALVIAHSGGAKMAQTPVALPFAQRVDFNVRGKLDDDLTSDSEVTYSVRSDAELYLRALLHSVSPANYAEFVQNFISGMGFGGTTSDASIENLDDPTRPLQVKFHYHRVKEKDWGENRVTAAFLLIGLPYFATDKPPISAIQIGSPRMETSTVEMQLPKDWSAELPPEVHQHTEFANVDVTYRVEGGKLIAQRSLVVLKKQVPVTGAKKYQTWFEASDAGSMPYIQLFPKPKEMTTATASIHAVPARSPGSDPVEVRDDPESAKLVEDGLKALRNMDMDTARARFDEAKKINPTQRGLWSGYAAMTQMLGEESQSVENGLRELSYHPDETMLYEPIARTQVQMKDNEGAMATLRKWEKASPDSPEAALALANALALQKQHAEVVKVADAAMARMKGKAVDTSDLLIRKATVLAEMRQTREAAELVAPLLGTQMSLQQVNNVAYVLAEGHSHLKEAEAALFSALGESEAETVDWKVTGSVRPYVAKQISLAQEWDTMGLILYQEGRYAESLSYFEAAAGSMDNAEVNKHLQLVATTLHKPNVGTETDLGRRTVHLGPAKGLNGVLNLNLLIVDGRVADLAVAQGAPAMSPMAQTGPVLVKTADLRGVMPLGSKAHLVRESFLNCHGSVCELVLSPLK